MTAGRARLEGVTTRNASAGRGWGGPPCAGRTTLRSPGRRTGAAGLSSSGSPGQGPGLPSGGAQVEEDAGGEGGEGELLGLVDQDRLPPPPGYLRRGIVRVC